MDFTKTIAIFIASELAPSMVDTLMLVSPGLQTSMVASPVAADNVAGPLASRLRSAN
jgi:hypothetical protein